MSAIAGVRICGDAYLPAPGDFLSMSDRFQRVCVTGGAGFIGSHLVRALLERGVAVTVIDDLSVGRRENVPEEARLMVGDIGNQEVVRAAMADSELVFHLAARVAIRSSFEFAFDDASINYSGTASVLQAAIHAGTVRRVIGTSSMAVYADAPGPMPVAEDHTIGPVSPYGVSKFAAEMLTHMMCAHAGIESTVLRLFNTYGPGQTYSPYVGVVTIFVNNLLRGEQPVIYGDGRQCRDFVHVHDVVQGFLSAMGSDAKNATINIGSGEGRTVNSVYESVRNCLGSGVMAKRAAAVAGELRYSIADISRARNLLAYAPAHSFEACIDAVIEEVRGGVAQAPAR